MVDYVKNVGTAGRMIIRDNGSTVSFIISCSDGATNVGSYVWSGRVNGVNVGGSLNLPSGFGSRTLGTWTVSSTQTVTWHQNATGTSGLGGAADHSAVITRGSTPPAPKVPGAPGKATVTQITTNSARFGWTAAAPNGAAVTGYGVYISKTNSYTSHVYNEWHGTALAWQSTAILQPNTTYYMRTRARNSAGTGPYAPSVQFKTLSGSPPILKVSSSSDGRSASATLGPPSGMSGVDSYTLEWRLHGGPTSWNTRVLNKPTTTTTVSGLNPGSIYYWRAKAKIGTYTSPYSAQLQITQKNPQTEPGQYFDGSWPAPPDGDVFFRWEPGGTAGASQSEAVGKIPTGWLDFGSGAGTSGGTGAVSYASGGRVAGGRVNPHSARVSFWTDTQVPGFRAGTSNNSTGRSPVLAGVEYVGSIYVQPMGQAQRLAAEISWYDTAGTVLTRSLGDGLYVQPGDQWTRLVVTDAAPTGATWASVRAIDVAGNGWSIWKSGSVLLLDDAMLSLGSVPYPYFDGAYKNTADYSYAWVGAENASHSRRDILAADTPEDPLADPDCPPVPPPPRPPIVIDECLEDTPSWRRYWSTIPAAGTSDWLTELPTMAITTGAGPARQIRIRIYANPFDWSYDQIDEQSYCSEQIVSYLPPNSTLTLDGPLQRAYAEVAGGPPISADHLLYGTGGTPATWPELSCGIEHVVSVDVPLDTPDVGNTTYTMTLTRRT
jgi:hypothetical protein